MRRIFFVLLLSLLITTSYTSSLETVFLDFAQAAGSLDVIPESQNNPETFNLPSFILDAENEEVPKNAKWLANDAARFILGNLPLLESRPFGLDTPPDFIPAAAQIADEIEFGQGAPLTEVLSSFVEAHGEVELEPFMLVPLVQIAVDKAMGMGFAVDQEALDVWKLAEDLAVDINEDIKEEFQSNVEDREYSPEELKEILGDSNSSLDLRVMAFRNIDDFEILVSNLYIESNRETVLNPEITLAELLAALQNSVIKSHLSGQKPSLWLVWPLISTYILSSESEQIEQQIKALFGSFLGMKAMIYLSPDENSSAFMTTQDNLFSNVILNSLTAPVKAINLLGPALVQTVFNTSRESLNNLDSNIRLNAARTLMMLAEEVETIYGHPISPWSPEALHSVLVPLRDPLIELAIDALRDDESSVRKMGADTLTTLAPTLYDASAEQKAFIGNSLLTAMEDSNLEVKKSAFIASARLLEEVTEVDVQQLGSLIEEMLSKFFNILESSDTPLAKEVVYSLRDLVGAFIPKMIKEQIYSKSRDIFLSEDTEVSTRQRLALVLEEYLNNLSTSVNESYIISELRYFQEKLTTETTSSAIKKGIAFLLSRLIDKSQEIGFADEDSLIQNISEGLNLSGFIKQIWEQFDILVLEGTAILNQLDSTTLYKHILAFPPSKANILRLITFMEGRFIYDFIGPYSGIQRGRRIELLIDTKGGYVDNPNMFAPNRGRWALFHEFAHVLHQEMASIGLGELSEQYSTLHAEQVEAFKEDPSAFDFEITGVQERAQMNVREDFAHTFEAYALGTEKLLSKSKNSKYSSILIKKLSIIAQTVGFVSEDGTRRTYVYEVGSNGVITRKEVALTEQTINGETYLLPDFN